MKVQVDCDEAGEAVCFKLALYDLNLHATINNILIDFLKLNMNFEYEYERID